MLKNLSKTDKITPVELKMKKIATFFFDFSLALFLCCGIIFFFKSSASLKKSGVNYFKSTYVRDFFTSAKKDSSQTLKEDSSMLAQKRLLLKENFKSLKEHYSDVSKELNLSIQNLIAITTLGLLLLFFENIIPKNGISVPLISIMIPINLIYLIVIFGLIYLWVHVGLLTNDANDCRLSLITLLNELETVGAERINYKYSLENILADSGIIDNMCAYFYHIFEDKSKTTSILSTFGLFGIYGSLFGISMGVCFTTIYEFAKREKLNFVYFLILFIFAATLYVLSTFVVCSKFQHMTVWFAWWWSICGAFMLFWRLARKTKTKPSNQPTDFYIN